MKVVFILLLAALPTLAAYKYQRTITIDHTRIGNTDLTNFPVLVKLSGVPFRSAGNGGHVQSLNGYDIGFYSDPALSVPLAWDIDSYDEVNGVYLAWVKIPSLSHTLDTNLYVGYGDATISNFQSSASSVWDSNFKAVYHLSETTVSAGSILHDSTGNANLTTAGGGGNTPSAQPGEIGRALNLPHVNQYSGGSAGSSSNAGLGTGNTTVQGWFNLNSVFPSDTNTTALFGTRRGNYPYGLNGLFLTSTGQFYGAEGGDYFSSGRTPAVSVGTWHQVAMTYDHSNVRIYLDGVLAVTSANSYALHDNPIFINSMENIYFSDAKYDELRLSSTARSADWLLTEYNNQSNPTAFCLVGTEQGFSSGMSHSGLNTVSGQALIF